MFKDLVNKLFNSFKYSISVIFLIAFFAAFNKNSFSQNSGLIVKSFYCKDTLQIRWAPENLALWNQLLRHGVKIKKYTIDEFYSADTKYKKQKPIDYLIKPLDFQDSNWLNIIKKDKRALLPFQVFSALQKNEKKSSAFSMFFSLALKTCDFNWEIAQASGLYLMEIISRDCPAQIYEFTYVNQNGITETKLLEFNPKKENHLPCFNPDSIYQNKRNVFLKWKVDSIVDQYAYFEVERSVDNSAFSRLTQNPLVFTYLNSSSEKAIYFSDTTLNSKGKYFYRIKAYSFFNLPSFVSTSVSIYFFPPIYSTPLLDSAISLPNGHNRIFSSVLNTEFLTTYDSLLILKKGSLKESWKTISSACIDENSVLNFSDHKIYPVTYYVVAIKFKDGDTVFSSSLRLRAIDNTPPGSPHSLKGKIDSSGIVRLSWKRNSEFDLMGYRVFRVNDTTEQAFEVSNILLSRECFFDTLPLNNLNQNVFYSIRAVDSSFNNSSYSLWLKIKKPDTIPPVPAQIVSTNFFQDKLSICIKSSFSEDVSQIDLLAYSKQEKAINTTTKMDFICFFSSVMNEDSMVLTDLVSGVNYKFQLQTRDHSGNNSLSAAVEVRVPDRNNLPKNSLRIHVLEDRSGIKLNWERLRDKSVFSYMVFKRKIPDPFFLLASFEKNKFNFLDTEVFTGNRYEYYLKVVYENGNQKTGEEIIQVDF